MRGIRFWIIGIISFLTATIWTVFIPNSFLNRAVLVSICTIFSFNATFCTPDLGLESDRVLAKSTSFERQQKTNNNSHLKFNLAFASVGKSGHQEITENALSTYWAPEENSRSFLKDEKGNLLTFQNEAVKEVDLADRGVDIKPDYLNNSSFISKIENTVFDVFDKNSHVFFSDTFYESGYHFDRESFLESSRQLKFRKADIVKELSSIKDANREKSKIRGKQARKYLGQALHTLQDFYAHTNWVELGFEEIDRRLGREEIPDPPGKISINSKTGEKIFNLYKRDTSEPINQKEIDEAAQFIETVNNTNNLSLLRLVNPGYARVLALIIAVGKTVLAGHTPEELASAISTKPGILKSEFTTPTKDNRFLTSGYFMGLDPISECSVPNGKTRHGGPSFLSIKFSSDNYGLCPNGLNKDDDSRGEGYIKASSLAKKATQDYIKQIIFEEPTISNNIEAIKALMGITTEKIPPTTPLKTGSSHNDPHLTTLDGLKYDLQTVGEYILIKSNTGNFEVQNRQEPYNASTAINSAVAIKVGRDRIALYAKEFPDSNASTPLRVNGKPTTIQGDKLSLADGGEILKQGNTYVIKSAKGEKVLVDLIGSGKSGFLNVSAFVPNRSGTYSGLLGNVNGNPNDDLQTRNGISISANRSSYKSEKLYLEQIHKKFANSWRIKQQESLFDYSVGKNTTSYTDLNFPDSYLVNNMLSADRLNKARNACIQAKVSQDLMQNCIYDVGFTGSTEFARATARVSDYAKIVDRLPLETRNSNIQKPSDKSLRIYAESYIRDWAMRLQNSGAKVSPIRSLIIEATTYPAFPYSGSVTTEAYPTLIFLFYYGQNGWITNSERIRIQGR